jgi:8-oxo-dGTP diphosphatase
MCTPHCQRLASAAARLCHSHRRYGGHSGPLWQSRAVPSDPTPPVSSGPSFIIGCCNLITDGSGYLLVQESKPTAWSRYNLPAGKPERGETLAEAAVREAKEETGLDVVISHLVGIYQCSLTSEGFGVVNFVFFADIAGGVLTPSGAHPVVRFFSTDEIADLVAERMVRGRYIPLAIADHERGIRLSLGLIQSVPAMGRPAAGP